MNLLDPRLLVFVLFLVFFSVLEIVLPLRQRPEGRVTTQINNLLLLSVGRLVVKFLPFLALAGVSSYAAENDIGLFHQLDLPVAFRLILILILLDFAIYLQHIIFHLVPVLWRLHAVHHAENHLDATSGLRFHPLEIILSQGYKMLWVLLLGASIRELVLFEIILSSMAIFNHSNLALPARVDRWLQYLIVTPRMHQMHHSIHKNEYNRNFGFNLSIWDRLFKTFIVDDEVELGLKYLPAQKSLWQMIVAPFIAWK